MRQVRAAVPIKACVNPLGAREQHMKNSKPGQYNERGIKFSWELPKGAKAAPTDCLASPAA